MVQRLLAAAALVSLVACGGGHKAATTTATVAPAASPAASPRAASAMHPQTQPVPASMDCGGTQPVWVNEHTRVFHLAGDPYYGRTKHGKYMCEKDAAKAGYHPSKT